MLKVLADGSVKTICYTFTMEKWLADIILSDAEKQQAASEKREQPKKERESKKGGKHLHGTEPPFPTDRSGSNQVRVGNLRLKNLAHR